MLPGYEYLVVRNDRADAFARAVEYLRESQMKLVGAVHDFTDPKTQQGYLYFPIRALEGDVAYGNE